MNLYALFDKKNRTFATPFVQPTDTHAFRVIGSEVRRTEGGNMLAEYPEDFQLWRLATFDESTGNVTDTKKQLAECEHMKAKAPGV